MWIVYGSRIGKLVGKAVWCTNSNYPNRRGYQGFCETIFESCLYYFQTIAVYLHGKRDIKQKSRAISIKDCCNCERTSGLTLPSREIGHQATMGQQASKVVSSNRHPRAWSKTMGIATIVVVIYIKEDLKPFWRVFEKTTGPISHFLVSFKPYCPSSGYRLSKCQIFGLALI